jgi:hypothetical protein
MKERRSQSELFKKAGMSDQDRIFYMLHGYHKIEDAVGQSLSPGDGVLYATSSRLRKAKVVGAVWEAKTKSFELTILTEQGREMDIDPKRVVKA